eukprot:6205208-Pleurochrysis_carterae.AAC.1
MADGQEVYVDPARIVSHMKKRGATHNVAWSGVPLPIIKKFCKHDNKSATMMYMEQETVELAQFRQLLNAPPGLLPSQRAFSNVDIMQQLHLMEQRISTRVLQQASDNTKASVMVAQAATAAITSAALFAQQSGQVAMQLLCSGIQLPGGPPDLSSSINQVAALQVLPASSVCSSCIPAALQVTFNTKLILLLFCSEQITSGANTLLALTRSMSRDLALAFQEHQTLVAEQAPVTRLVGTSINPGLSSFSNSTSDGLGVGCNLVAGGSTVALEAAAGPASGPAVGSSSSFVVPADETSAINDASNLETASDAGLEPGSLQQTFMSEDGSASAHASALAFPTGPSSIIPQQQLQPTSDEKASQPAGSAVASESTFLFPCPVLAFDSLGQDVRCAAMALCVSKAAAARALTDHTSKVRCMKANPENATGQRAHRTACGFAYWVDGETEEPNAPRREAYCAERLVPKKGKVPGCRRPFKQHGTDAEMAGFCNAERQCNCFWPREFNCTCTPFRNSKKGSMKICRCDPKAFQEAVDREVRQQEEAKAEAKAAARRAKVSVTDPNPQSAIPPTPVECNNVEEHAQAAEQDQAQVELAAASAVPSELAAAAAGE